MDLFRLTYFVGQSTMTNKWDAMDRYEIFGSSEAIFNMWFNLKLLKESNPASAHPQFIEIYNKDGIKQDLSKGLYGMSNVNTFK